jgi:hypothetical protein
VPPAAAALAALVASSSLSELAGSGSRVNPFTAEWSERGHNLCVGHWQVSYLGQPVEMPDLWREMPLGTYGNFSFLFPDDPEYADGMEEQEWLASHVDWLTDLFIEYDIPLDEEHLAWFYRAINRSDWRCESCGGCL